MHPRRSIYGILPLLLLGLIGPISNVARALNPRLQPAQATRQSWSTDNGLPQNSVHAIFQSSDGFVWIATEGGLARFDGYQFRIFDTESTPRLPGNDIRSFAEDGSGGLWIGTSAGLAWLNEGEIKTFTVNDGLPSDDIRTLLQMPDGTLWVLTSAGLARSNAAHDAGRPAFHTFTRSEGLLSDSITAIAADEHAGVWVGTTQGLNHIVAGRVEAGPKETLGAPIEALSQRATTGSSPAPPGLLLATPDAVLRVTGTTVFTLINHTSQSLGRIHTLIGTSAGVWAAGRSGVVLVEAIGSRIFSLAKDLPGSQIYTMFQDRHGAIWISTNTGLSRYMNQTMQTLPGGGDSAFSAVLALYEDREGNLWTGAETGGLGVLRDPLFTIIGRRSGAADEAVTSVLQAADRSLWIGTNGGGLSQLDLDRGTSHIYLAKDGLSSDTVLALATNGATLAEQAELWVGTPDGLNQLHNGHWSLYSSADGLADDLVRSLLADKAGDLWIGTRRGLTRWRQGHGTTWTTANGLGSDLVGAMVQDTSGDLWIGTLGGLSQMHHETLHNYTLADGLPSNTITALETDTRGTLWIGTKDQGLAMHDGQSFFSFAKATKLPRNIFAILQDGRGFLWLSSDRGIYRVEQRALEAFRAGLANTVDVVSYGTGDGLPSLETSGAGHPAAWRLQDGRLCFASRRGIILFDPNDEAVRGAALPVVLEQFTVDGRDVDARAMGAIPAGASQLSFSFAGINFAAPQRVQYRYKLDGFDKDWIESGTRRTAYYTNLSPGHYTFHVAARLAGGAWDEPGAAISVRLLPRFYQTVLFRIALLLCAGGVIFGLFRIRLRTLQLRFEAVSAERNRIAREIHDTLAQGFVAVSVRLEIMSQLLRKPAVEACREQLDQTRTLVRDSLAEARRSIWDLRAEGTDSMTLPARLARAVQQTSSNGIGARLETTGTYRPLDRSMEDELLRIAQEAMANAVRHAQASSITMRLTYIVESILMEIIDDGRGFDLAQAPSSLQGHFGLVGMQERARKIGATVTLESRSALEFKGGSGTTVRVEKRLSSRQAVSRKDLSHG